MLFRSVVEEEDVGEEDVEEEEDAVDAEEEEEDEDVVRLVEDVEGSRGCARAAI